MTSRAIVLAVLLALVPAGQGWAKSLAMPQPDATAAAAAIRPPFDVADVRAHRGKPVDQFACQPVPNAVTSIDPRSKYRQTEGKADIDPDAERAYTELLAPVRTYARTVSKTANLFVASSPPSPAIAQCVVDWLAGWAQADALLGSDGGEAVRAQILPVVALAYVEVRGGEGLNAGARLTIEGWLRRLADRVRADYSTDPTRGSRNNNLRYGAAWAVMASAVALNDRSMFDWAVDGYRIGVNQIAPDGTLPLEMARRQRALGYHLVAVQPLVLIAETAAANGLDLYHENNGALLRLVDRTVGGLDDPGFFESALGIAQVLDRGPNAAQMAWLVPYSRRFPGIDVDAWRQRLGGFANPAVGGDADLLYGAG